MLSTAEITAMRATSDAALPDTVQVHRRTLTSDGQGGSTEAWATIATVAGRLSPAHVGDGEPEIAGRLVAEGDWVATLPHATDVVERDRLVNGALTIEVRRVETPRSWGLQVRARGARVQ